MRQLPKRLRAAVSDHDRISNLPSNVIEQILSRVPFRDAARTSVLSRNWRYKWSELPYLVFDYDSCPSDFQKKLDSVPGKFASIVDHVLLLHRGQILSFDLSYTRPIPKNVMDRWIMHLSRNPIKELELRVYQNDYWVPSCLFTCQSLTYLLVHHCPTIKIPSAFKGFVNLTSLNLHFRKMESCDLENLISGCPVLENLYLGITGNILGVTVRAPNLVNFRVDGNSYDISLENTIHLADVTLSVSCPGGYELGKQLEYWRKYSNFLKIFAQLPMIRTLYIDNFYLERLAFGVAPGEVPTSHVSLDSLTLEIKLNDREDCSRALCILSIFRNLRDLTIMDCSLKDKENNVTERESDNSWEDDYSSCRFTALKFVEITDCRISGTNNELDIVKFMLSNSPVLEKMVVKLHDDHTYCDDGPIIMFGRKLLILRRASKSARVIF